MTPFEILQDAVVGGDVANKIARMNLGTYNPYREFNVAANDIFYSSTGLSFIPDASYSNFGETKGYYLATYLRDFILGSIVYWATAAVWHIAIYRILGNTLFTSKKRNFPTAATIIDQICLAQSSLVVYAGLPVLSELMIENKITRVYFYVDEVGGWGMYFLYFFAYIALVEIGIYWMHRTLHTNKFLYKYVHGLHHKYNKAETLTPWASLAFNPLDGCLQVRFLRRYIFVLLLFPVKCHVFSETTIT
jgi:Delta7-sterol 5-desaturase